MALNNAFFNIRPTRRSNPEARTTLDALHTFQIDKLKGKQGTLDIKKAELNDISIQISISIILNHILVLFNFKYSILTQRK